MHTFSPYVVTAYQLEVSRPCIKSSSKLIPIPYYCHMKVYTKMGMKLHTL